MTDSVLVDTNVVSYLVKGDSRCERYRPDLEGRRLCIAFATVAELRLWAIYGKWGERKREGLEQTLRSYVVVPFDDRVATEWAQIASDALRTGRNAHDRNDWWIAACALRHDLPLVTHNAGDFAGIANLRVISHPDTP